MKKIIGMAFLVLVLLLPLTATAAPLFITPVGDAIGQLDLKVNVTPNISGAGYYTDYQAMVAGTGETIELFCVEDQAADLTNFQIYDLYRLETDNAINQQVTWIAENYWDASATDKGQAQLAIWHILNTISFNLASYSGAQDIYDSAMVSYGSANLTSNWLLATNTNHQNYILRADPIPEPATMLLLGAGLLGLAGVNRKRFRRQ